jgi:glycerophosphoryl diester phosphodiesterase
MVRIPQPLAVTRVLGHRGAGLQAPENTLAAIRRASQLGVQWVEFDVRRSLDGALMLMHDESLERTTNGHGLLNTASLADLQTLDAGSWFSAEFADETIPTLGEAIAVMAQLGIAANVEIKVSADDDPRIGAEVAALLARDWPPEFPSPIISSFAEAPLIAARGVAPQMPRMLIVDTLPGDWRVRLDGLGCRHINVGHETLTRQAAQAVCAAGITLLCFTVNDQVRARELFSWGVEAVFSDVPERILPGSNVAE